MQIAQYLEKRKEELGLSLSDMERQLTLLGYEAGKSTIGHWMNGTRKPPLKNRKFLEALSITFKTSIPEMLMEMGLVEADWPVDHTPEALKAATIIDMMPPDQRRKAIKVLEAMRDE